MSSLSGLKILIVDDHFLIRQFVHTTLHKQGVCTVEAVTDGDEAICLIQQAKASGNPYDIVLLDWILPSTSGLDVLTLFRANEEYADTAFVMITSKADQASIMQAIKSGATSYIIKPVSPDDLNKKLYEVRAWLEHKRAASADKNYGEVEAS